MYSGATLPGRDRIHPIRRLCAARSSAYVRAPPTVSKVGLTLTEPSEEQVAAGQAWVWCDALQTASFNVAVGVPRTGSLEHALARRVPLPCAAAPTTGRRSTRR